MLNLDAMRAAATSLVASSPVWVKRGCTADGCDCLGYALWLFERGGRKIKHESSWWRGGKKFTQAKHTDFTILPGAVPRAGDLAIFVVRQELTEDECNFCGVMLDDATITYNFPDEGVYVTKLTPSWRKRLWGVARLK
jgi:hypothetical protein